jgi:hypothetical protein
MVKAVAEKTQPESYEASIKALKKGKMEKKMTIINRTAPVRDNTKFSDPLNCLWFNNEKSHNIKEKVVAEEVKFLPNCQRFKSQWLQGMIVTGVNGEKAAAVLEEARHNWLSLVEDHFRQPLVDTFPERVPAIVRVARNCRIQKNRFGCWKSDASSSEPGDHQGFERLRSDSFLYQLIKDVYFAIWQVLWKNLNISIFIPTDVLKTAFLARYTTTGFNALEMLPGHVFASAMNSARKDVVNFHASLNAQFEKGEAITVKPPTPSSYGARQRSITMLIGHTRENIDSIIRRYCLPRFLKLQQGQYADLLNCKADIAITCNYNLEAEINLGFFQLVSTSADQNVGRKGLQVFHPGLSVFPAAPLLSKAGFAAFDPNISGNFAIGVSLDSKVGVVSQKFCKVIKAKHAKLNALKSQIAVAQKLNKSGRVGSRHHNKNYSYKELLKDRKVLEEDIEFFHQELEEKIKELNDCVPQTEFMDEKEFDDDDDGDDGGVRSMDEGEEEEEEEENVLKELIQLDLVNLKKELTNLVEEQEKVDELIKNINQEAKITGARTAWQLADMEDARRKLVLEIARTNRDHRNQASSGFARGFQVIGFPTFETEDMVKKQQENGARRRIPRSVAGWMNVYAFGRFRRSLQAQCLKHGSVCLITNEAYTSQVHYNCLKKQKKSSSQILICKTPSCNGERNQRDENSCVNQWFKTLVTQNGAA